jgi:transcription initiation factor TFIIIB Brf1 subunit/transcription initiation factor TFIIB
MEWKPFGEVLKRFDLTQKEFAQIIGISEQTINNHKRRGRFPAGYYGIFKAEMQSQWIQELNDKIVIFEEIFE